MSDDFAGSERPFDLPVSPYVGLVPYGERDADFFFGRDDETQIVSGNLRASDLTLLYGASGVGKTSLLRAGVVHDLDARARETELVLSTRAPYVVCSFQSWRDEPIPALMETIRAAVESAMGEGDVPPWQPGTSVVAALRSWTERVRTILVVLDQFEDYFLYHPDEQGPGTFAGELPGIVNDPNLRIHVLLSIREDALAKLDRFKGSIPRLFANYVRIEHLSRVAARDAVEGPLREWNRRQPRSEPPYELGPRLVEAVIDATATGGVTLVRNGGRAETQTPDPERVEAPFLQLVMERLWRDAANEGSRDLTVERLDRLGGPQRIVENHLLEALGALSSSEQDVAADLFRFLVTTSKTKIAHPTSDLAEWTGREENAVEPVLDKLCRGESGRILRRVPPPPKGNGATRYELYHDVLAEPILEWRREHDEERRRRAFRRRVLRIGTAVLALVALISGLAVLALIQRNEARTATRSAASLALASAATEQLPDRVDEALLLALDGYRESASPDAASAMVESLSVAGRSGATAILRGHPRGVRAIAWSPDGHTFASADFEGEIRLWDVEERRPLGDPLTGHQDEIWSIAFSPDATKLASASDDGTIRLWDVGDGTAIGVLEPDDDGIQSSVAWSPDGATLAAAGGPGTIELWDVETQEPLGPPLDGHDDRVVSLAFSPDGERLASASYDGTVGLWNASSGTLVERLENAHDGAVLSIAWSPDGRKLVSSGSDGVMRIWDVRLGRSLGRPFGPDTGDIWGVDWSTDGRTIASSGEDHTVRLWDAQSGEQIGEPLRGHLDRVTAVAFAPDGRMLASANYDRTVRLWPMPPAVLGAPFGRHEDQVKTVAYSPDGRLLASADFGGTVRLWDTRSGVLRAQLEDEQTSSLEIVAWSPDGRTLASVGDGIVVWDTGTGKPIATLDGHEGTVESAAWSRDGNLLASAGADGTVRVWDVARRTQLGTELTGHEGTVWGVAWNPDGTALVSAGADSTLRFWDVDRHMGSGQVRLEDGDVAQTLAWSPDGEMLATGSVRGLVQLWDADARTPLGEPLAGHELELTSVAFSPDGRRLVSADRAGVLRLWDIEGRRGLGEALPASDREIESVQFAPDSLSFASGGSDGAVRLWEGILWRDLDDLESRVCSLVIGDLSEEDWDRLVPGLSYRPSCE